MMGNPFEGLAVAFLTLLVIAPLGVWKLVEIIAWLVRHIHWSVS